MTYRNQLSPWCIIQKLPDLQNVFVVRLRRRTEATEYLKALQRLNPQSDYELIFDLLDRSQPTTQPDQMTQLENQQRSGHVRSGESAF